MARVLSRNLYELSATKVDRLIKGSPNVVSFALSKELDRLERFKKFQDENIVMGGLHRIQYRFFQHDPRPLVIFFNEIKGFSSSSGVKFVPGLNLHYLITREASLTLNLINRFNVPRIARGFPPALIWEMAKKIPVKLLPYRLYALNGIRPIEYIPLADWEDVAKSEANKWQGFRDF